MIILSNRNLFTETTSSILIALALFLCGLPLGFAQNIEEETVDVRLKRAIIQSSHLPLDQSLAKVGPLLWQAIIFLPNEGDVKKDEDGNQKVGLYTAKDKFGRDWVYGYTEVEEFLKVHPQGASYVAMDFKDIFKMVRAQKNFGGIFLNSGARQDSYPIPIEFFDELEKIRAEF